MDAVRRIARTVLYEGHVLWPYRRTALKNRERWTFGRLYPDGHRAEGDASRLQLQVLLEADADARVSATLRFLQLVERRVLRHGRPVDALELDGRRYLAWDEATEREIVAAEAAVGAPACRRPFALPAGRDEEALHDARGARAGALLRTWRDLDGVVTLATEPVEPAVWRVTVAVVNTTPWSGAGRLLAATLLSAHVVLTTAGGRFVSAQDPPGALRAAAAACRNVGAWPVLAGEPGERGTILAAPIVLYDYPRIAPESPGDFFDATEVDELLVLNVLGLTDEERREMAASDPRAREIVERCAALSADDLLRLHGAVRDRRPLGEA